MTRIYRKGYEVLVGDCYGVDSSVQAFYSNLNYQNVILYAGNGKARNNIGSWAVRKVPVPPNVRGFDFYKQKDVAMANDADYGFMIWDGKSKGTLNNIIDPVTQNKTVLVCLTTRSAMTTVNNTDKLNALINGCERETQTLYRKLCATASVQSRMQP